MKIPVIISILLLAGCGEAPIEHSGCPPLKQYSAESNKAFEQTFKKIPPDAQKRIVDYRQLRKECGQK